MPPAEPLRLVTLAPGHFHAALVHQHRPPDVDRRVTVFAPDDADTALHIARVSAFNARPDSPTDWELDVRTGPDFLDRFAHEVTPGSAVVIAGRNAPKIDLIRAAVGAGCHVLADKPWVIDAGGYAKLPDVMREAEARGVVVSDLMTERHEVTATLLRDLIRQPDTVGEVIPSTGGDPAVLLASLHYLTKTVAGQPLRRPAWWFDADVAGPAVADVGTHLVDLAMWLLFPGQEVSPAEITGMMTGMSWPTEVSRSRFAAMTGLPDFPSGLVRRVSDAVLHYQGNGMFTLTVRGVHARVLVSWAVERGGDDQAEGNEIIVRGTNAVVLARSVATLTGTDRPELRVTPTVPNGRAATADALQRWCDPRGLAVEDQGPHLSVTIPARIVTPHESHFRQVFDGFVRRIRNPAAAFEPENLIAKYFVTTTAAGPARGP